MQKLILELERSHRAEAVARQQAADAVAARQLLSEASTTSIAELEAALIAERQRKSARLRVAEDTLVSKSASLHIDTHVLQADMDTAWS